MLLNDKYIRPHLFQEKYHDNGVLKCMEIERSAMIF